MTGAPVDPFEAAMLTGAITALRQRAAAIRARASSGVTVLDRRPPVRVVTSESATSLRIAKSFDEIATDLESECAIPARN
jgi:hypothetical protein